MVKAPGEPIELGDHNHGHLTPSCGGEERIEGRAAFLRPAYAMVSVLDSLLASRHGVLTQGLKLRGGVLVGGGDASVDSRPGRPAGQHQAARRRTCPRNGIANLKSADPVGDPNPCSTAELLQEKGVHKARNGTRGGKPSPPGWEGDHLAASRQNAAVLPHDPGLLTFALPGIRGQRARDQARGSRGVKMRRSGAAILPEWLARLPGPERWRGHHGHLLDGRLLFCPQRGADALGALALAQAGDDRVARSSLERITARSPDRRRSCRGTSTRSWFASVSAVHHSADPRPGTVRAPSRWHSDRRRRWRYSSV